MIATSAGAGESSLAGAAPTKPRPPPAALARTSAIRIGSDNSAAGVAAASATSPGAASSGPAASSRPLSSIAARGQASCRLAARRPEGARHEDRADPNVASGVVRDSVRQAEDIAGGAGPTPFDDRCSTFLRRRRAHCAMAALYRRTRFDIAAHCPSREGSTRGARPPARRRCRLRPDLRRSTDGRAAGASGRRRRLC